MLQRAYSVLHIKAVDAERRVITGKATTPTPDRLGDVVEPHGVKFKNPLSLLLFHDGTRPVGTVRLSKPTDDGIDFEAHIPDITEPGTLKERVDEAWQSVKAKLIRGVSIGFRVLDDGIELLRTGGVRFTNIEVLELSLVSVPANSEAIIETIKSIDARDLAASGKGHQGESSTSAGVAATVKGTRMAKTIAEQISTFEATRQAKSARMTEIQEKASNEGRTKDHAEKEEFDGLNTDIKGIDIEMADLRDLDQLNKTAATVVKGATADEAARSRGNGNGNHPVITMKQTRAPGIGIARAMLCRMASFLAQGSVSPVDVAKARYPDDPEIQLYLKASVAGGTTTDTNWATALVEPTTLASEFVEFLRPMTIIGKFGTANIPSLRRLPFNIRIPRQTTGGTGYWVGEGAPKPLTKFHFDDVTLPYTKVAAIAVITRELARFSTPSAETIVRDQLARACVERIDTDFVDPAKAVSSGVNPASITNGLTALSSAGTSADNARTDIQNLLESFILANLDPTSLVIIMPSTLALALSIMVNSLGQREFPDLTMRGGTLLGIPVITSQYAASAATFGNMVIAVNANDVGLADDGQVDVDISSEASLEMLDNPTNSAATPTPTTMVSMFQTNSLALRAERFINWVKLRSTAVVFMDDVNWGAIGSPV